MMIGVERETCSVIPFLLLTSHNDENNNNNGNNNAIIASLLHDLMKSQTGTVRSYSSYCAALFIMKNIREGRRCKRL